MSVTINAPKTPVTKGSKGVAAATLPNPCKMPGPPPPFVPTPLPNVGKSGDSPKGYTKSVKVEGQPAAIRGASFGSQGDMASKATGGGLVSATTHGRTTFVGPGSKDVKFEGKSVQLLGDPMFNNCGAGGRTPNSATMVGVLQESGLLALAGDEVCSLCGKEHEDAGKLEETVDTKGDADVLHAAVERAVAKAKAERDRRVAPERARLEAKAQQDYEARRSKLEANMNAARAHGRMEAAAKIEGQLARLQPAPVNVSAPDVALGTMMGVVRCKDGQVYAGTSSMQWSEIIEELPSGWHAPVGQRSLVEGRPAWVDRFADFEKFVSDKATFAETWETLSRESIESRQGRTFEPFHRPGRCAAQQVLLLALEHGGRPAGLTERRYKAGNPSAAVTVAVRDSLTAPPRLAAFGGRNAVPPCGTCQVILTMLLCPEDRGPDCEHRAPAKGVCRCT